VTTTGAEAAEAAKFVPPLYVTVMLLFPMDSWETWTAMTAIPLRPPVDESSPEKRLLVPRTVPLVTSVNVTAPSGAWAK
jgi:hypothetical protein